MKHILSRILSAALAAVAPTLTLLALTSNAHAQYTETVLYNFGATGDSVFPMSGLIFDGSGNLFGATKLGGSNDSGDAYELSPSSGGGWTEDILYSFFGGTGVSEPSGNLVFDTEGNLYGTSVAGGSNRTGTVFEISPTSSGSWTQTILHNFGGGTDGKTPEGTPIFDTKGNLYATTAVGGLGFGTVVELSPSASGHWTEKIIYNFTGGSDGSEPGGNLIFDAAGNLYGTAFGGGGTTTCTTGCGTVFRLTPMGPTWRFTRVFAFGGHDGTYPSALTIDGAGNLYGVAREGGFTKCTGGCGNIFKLTGPGTNGLWKETVLYNFTGENDGATPAGVVLDSADNVFGAASVGGTDNEGTVFEISPASGGGWTFSVLYSFQGQTDGGIPAAGVILDSAGNLYGTTTYGGSLKGGVAFELSPSPSGGR